MRDDERRELLQLLDATSEVYERPPLTPAAKRMWVADLGHLPMEAIHAAFALHRRGPNGRFMPRPSDILTAVREATAEIDGHLSPDEAWSIAIQARGEDASVVWTQEIAAAFYEAAVPLLDAGDRIAARKAFLERYEREVIRARDEGRRAAWFASLGHDPDARQFALDQAVSAGRLTAEHAAKLLPTPQPSAAAVMLLTGVREASKATSPEEARRRIAELRQALKRGA